MAFRKPVRVKDTVRILAIGDDAIDYEAWDKAAMRAYARCEDLDVSKIPLIDGASPVWIHIRGLGDHERAVATSAAEGNAAHMARTITRHGIVRVEGIADWDGDRRDYCGFQVLTSADLDLIPPEVHTHLAQAILSLSMLDAEKKSHSGSSRTIPSGATTSTVAPSPSAAAPGATPG